VRGYRPTRRSVPFDCQGWCQGDGQGLRAPPRLVELAKSGRMVPYADARLGGLPVDFLADRHHRRQQRLTHAERSRRTNGPGLRRLRGDGSDWVFMRTSPAASTSTRFMTWVMDAVDSADHLLREMGRSPRSAHGQYLAYRSRAGARRPLPVQSASTCPLTPAPPTLPTNVILPQPEPMVSCRLPLEFHAHSAAVAEGDSALRSIDQRDAMGGRLAPPLVIVDSATWHPSSRTARRWAARCRRWTWICRRSAASTSSAAGATAQRRAFTTSWRSS
jgi:hypothetical protein